MTRLANKIGIVTGAASGIGAETALRLAREGASVVVADINHQGAEARAASIRAAGHVAIAARLDLADEDSISAVIRLAVEHFGGLDILCNNAASTQLSSSRDAPIETMDNAVWDAIMQTNLRGTMLACRYAIAPLRARGGGAIVNIASGAGVVGMAMLTSSAYAASKAGIITLTQYVATQHGKENIRCNAIAPGLIVTPSTEKTYADGPVGAMMLRHHLTPRLGRPADIAAAVVYLASDEAGFVTGQILNVDGGLSAHAPFYADTYVPSDQV
jgi:NAD(P)-dependent dehydrogenase (short-subunit alcohol dehydrogenase family)